MALQTSRQETLFFLQSSCLTPKRLEEAGGCFRRHPTTPARPLSAGGCAAPRLSWRMTLQTKYTCTSHQARGTALSRGSFRAWADQLLTPWTIFRRANPPGLRHGSCSPPTSSLEICIQPRAAPNLEPPPAPSCRGHAMFVPP